MQYVARFYFEDYGTIQMDVRSEVIIIIIIIMVRAGFSFNWYWTVLFYVVPLVIRSFIHSFIHGKDA